MRRVRRPLCLAAALATVLLLSGCWDYNDPEDYIYVSGMAFDRDTDGRLRNTVEFSSMKGSKQNSTPAYFRIEGDTFYDTLRNGIKVSEAKLNWSHAQVCIVSQDIAKNELGDLVDMLLRVPGFRDTIVVLVSKEGTAEQVLTAATSTGDLVTMDIMGSLKAEEALEKAPYIRLYEFVDRIRDERQSAVLPAVGITRDKPDPIVEVSGAAVFRGLWLQGFLDENDTRMYMLLGYKRDLYDLPLPADPQGEFTSANVEFDRNNVKLKPSFESGKASMDITIQGSIIINELSGASTDPKKQREVSDAVIRVTATEIENSAASMILRTKQMGGCDVLGVGERLRNRQPEVWKKINGQWREYYSGMSVRVRAKLTMRNTGYQQDPVVKGR